MKYFKSHFPLILIIAAFAWSSVVIATRRVAEVPKDALVIRIGHWQLESSVRQSINEVGKAFAADPRMKKKYGNRAIIVMQDAIPEGAYGQWITSQMMGETAPDLVEIGNGLAAPIWLAYQNRYFVSLSSMADEPNPFNEGTALEGMPLRETFTDAMRSGYVEELQQYMTVPFARATIRIFYNKELLRTLTGLEKPPTDFRGFLKVCQEISEQKDGRGNFYTPIASSAYNMNMWQYGLFDSLTYANLRLADFNRDGSVGNDEFFAAMKTGALSFDSPAVRIRLLVAREVMKYFQPGFTGLQRDDAVFLFAQQRAVFIPTGTWDAGSLVEQTKETFNVGVMDFPMPLPDDPEYGSVMLGPRFEDTRTGFPFGLTRFSKHPEVARDFLLYVTSLKGNTQFNSIVGWIPSVRGAPLPPALKEFVPRSQGMYGCFNVELGGKTVVRWRQDYSKFQSDPSFTFDDFKTDFSKFYLEHGLEDWKEQQRDWRRTILKNEQQLSGARGAAMLDSGGEDSALWVKYRSAVMSRQVMPEVSRAIQVRLVTEGPMRPSGPYELLPEAAGVAGAQRGEGSGGAR